MNETERCKECGQGAMVLREGKHGSFMACDQFPECKNTEKIFGAKAPVIQAPPQPVPFDTKPKKEFHLSPEQVDHNERSMRLGALNAAIIAKVDGVDLMIMVKQFEEYLWNGK